jgi:hypothetical protein
VAGHAFTNPEIEMIQADRSHVDPNLHRAGLRKLEIDSLQYLFSAVRVYSPGFHG